MAGAQPLWSMWKDPTTDARLRALWDVLPPISCNEIGRQMGCTKNAIVGRVHRLGLPPRLSPIGVHKAGSKPRAVRRPPMPRLPSMASAAAERTVAKLAALTVREPPPRPPAPVPLWRRAAVISTRRCLWLDGERWAFVQCDDLALEGYSYCRCHRNRAYVREAA